MATIIRFEDMKPILLVGFGVSIFVAAAMTSGFIVWSNASTLFTASAVTGFLASLKYPAGRRITFIHLVVLIAGIALLLGIAKHPNISAPPPAHDMMRSDR